jgi:hypothetical protein
MYNSALYTYTNVCTYMHPHWKPQHLLFHGLTTSLITYTQYMYDTALYKYIDVRTYIHLHWKPLYPLFHGLATSLAIGTKYRLWTPFVCVALKHNLTDGHVTVNLVNHDPVMQTVKSRNQHKNNVHKKAIGNVLRTSQLHHYTIQKKTYSHVFLTHVRTTLRELNA